MLLRYLKPIVLKHLTKTKQPNGIYKDTYETIETYKVMKQNLTDEVDAQVYGSDVNKIIRLKTPKGDLEDYLYQRLSNEEDNVSKYVIYDGNTKYKIVAVNQDKVDIERL